MSGENIEENGKVEQREESDEPSEHEKKEREMLLEIFPSEIWTKVLEFVEDPDDLLASSRSFMFWNNILEPRRVEFLFPEVLKVLSEQKYFYKKDCSELLKYRLVCKIWMLGVNSIFENRAPIDKLEFTKYHHHVQSHFAFPTYFRLYKPKIQDILETRIAPLLSSPRYKQSALRKPDNPFPSRYLEIMERRLTNTIVHDWNEVAAVAGFGRYRHMALQFLQVAGHHFWYAEIDAGLNMEPLDWYNLITSYIQLMPNLKFLYIYCPWFCSYEIDILSQAPPFPTLPHLQLLSLENTPNCVMNAILAQNTKLKVVIVIPKLRLPTQQEQLETLNYSSVQDPHTFSTCFTSQREFNCMPREWKLKMLRLGLKSCIDLHWPSIFNKLEFYRDSLTELFLQLPKANTPDNRLILWESSRAPMNLPKLKRLDIEVANYCSFDFLLGLVSLEYLRMHLVHHEYLPPHKGTEKQLLNVNKVGFACFHICNIWNLIPSLKKVDIQLNSGLTQTYTKKQGEVLHTETRPIRYASPTQTKRPIRVL